MIGFRGPSRYLEADIEGIWTAWRNMRVESEL